MAETQKDQKPARAGNTEPMGREAQRVQSGDATTRAHPSIEYRSPGDEPLADRARPVVSGETQAAASEERRG